MEDNTELLEKYIEEGKLPLKGELFSRKAKIAEKLRLYREESRRITVSRQRKRGGERRHGACGKHFPANRTGYKGNKRTKL